MGQGLGTREGDPGASKPGFVNRFIGTLSRSLTTPAALSNRAEVSSQTPAGLQGWQVASRALHRAPTPALGAPLSVPFSVRFDL